MAQYDPTIPKELLIRAERGEQGAQYRLGLYYATEDTSAECLIMAHMWFNIAAISGDARAKVERKEMAEMMSAAEIAEAQKRARAQLQFQRG
jgi:hypothetical protein